MTELEIVVDENDVVVGYKPRAEIDPVNEFYRISSLRLSNEIGEVLIAQRSYNKTHSPGKRGPTVAGTLAKGETYEENIIKEIEEEIGLKDLQITKGPKVKHEGERKFFCQRFFAAIEKDNAKFSIDKEELEAIKRISKHELKQDMEHNPEKYLASMEECIQIL